MWPELYNYSYDGGGGFNPFAREFTHGAGYNLGFYNNPFANAAAAQNAMTPIGGMDFEGNNAADWRGVPVVRSKESPGFLDYLQQRMKTAFLGEPGLTAKDIGRYGLMAANPALAGATAGMATLGAAWDWIKNRAASGEGIFGGFDGEPGDIPEGFADAISGPAGGAGIGQGGGGAWSSGGGGAFGGELGTGGGAGDPYGSGSGFGGSYGGPSGPPPGGYMGNPNIGMMSSWEMPVAGSNVGIPIIQGPSWVGPGFNPELGY
jgi:hypothetical protein